MATTYFHGLTNILLSALCSNYPPTENNSTINSPGPDNDKSDVNESPFYNFSCILKNNDQVRRDLLRGKKLKIATLENDWPLSSTSLNPSGVLVGKGIAFEIVETLQEFFGFTYSVQVPTENILGNENTGILGLLYSGSVDMAAAFLPVLHGKHVNLQWSTELIQNNYYVLMKRPMESASGSGLLAPFELQVWMLILVSLLLVAPIMYFIIKLRDKLCRSDHSKRFPMSSCAWFVFGGLMKQGSILNPITDSSRILFATWWIFVMILTSFYTANLTAFLTLSKFTLPIQSVDDIGRLSYQWFTHEGSALEHAIKVDGDLGVLRQSALRGFGHFIDVRDMRVIKQLVSRDWLYLDEKRSLEYFLLEDYLNKTSRGVLEKDRCTYVITQDSYLTRSMAFAFPKHSILPSLFNPVMLSYVESGIISQLATNSIPETTICPLNLRSKERQLRNSDLYTTYLVVVSGFITGSIIFIIENLWRKFISPSSSKTSWPIDDIINYNNNKKMNGYLKWKRKFTLLSKNTPKTEVNGREYYIITTSDGSKRLIPVRPLSSFLFQYK